MMQFPPEQVIKLADEYIKDALIKVEEAKSIKEAEACMERGGSLLKIAVVLSALTASVVLIKSSSIEYHLEQHVLESENTSPSFVEGQIA
ncbi:MAG TPA: hypothetical protein G4O11_02315 [Anaerolineae bacterium]|nr:MAG: hypothetical protein AMJ88_16735 [Anaerolineae bacterium SM23_ 63]HEY42795.1 hypothetical protein [Anaerolineae bacterium]